MGPGETFLVAWVVLSGLALAGMLAAIVRRARNPDRYYYRRREPDGGGDVVTDAGCDGSDAGSAGDC